MRTLEIGGVVISVEASDRISQTYEAIGGVATLRTMSGGGIRQRNWRRLRTTISVPQARWFPALQALDQDSPVVIKCLAPRHIKGVANVVTLPTARRADVSPWGFATMPDGFSARTSGVLSGNTFTLTPVSGAAFYTAMYVPQLTCLITSLQEHMDVRQADVGWDLTAEEI